MPGPTVVHCWVRRSHPFSVVKGRSSCLLSWSYHAVGSRYNLLFCFTTNGGIRRRRVHAASCALRSWPRWKKTRCRRFHLDLGTVSTILIDTNTYARALHQLSQAPAAQVNLHLVEGRLLGDSSSHRPGEKTTDGSPWTIVYWRHSLGQRTLLIYSTTCTSHYITSCSILAEQ